MGFGRCYDALMGTTHDPDDNARESHAVPSCASNALTRRNEVPLLLRTGSEVVTEELIQQIRDEEGV